MSTHNEVAHAWANQTGRHRKGFNMFYEGDTIYSYGHHFPIARIVQTEDGPVVLFTTDSYSVSTSKHKTYTWRACHHMKVFHVPLIRNRIQEAFNEVNVKDYITRIEERLQKAKRARVYAAMHLREANALIAEAQEYIRCFKVEGYENFTWEPDAIVEGVREAARIQAEAEAERRRQQEIAARARYRTQIWPLIKSWLRGGETTLAHRMYTSRPLPRIVGDYVFTTWGASVPLEIAKKLYWVSIKCRRDHTEWVPAIPFRVGDFSLTRIKPNGDLVVGCHDIPFWFMRYAACLKGIPSQPEGATA